MKTKLANLQLSTSTSLSDLDKTFTGGRAIQKTVDGVQVIAPPLTTFADVQTAFGVSPANCDVNVVTGRKFELQNTTTNAPTVLAFDFDLATGTWTYIGKIIMMLPLGVHAYRCFSFDDSNTSNMKFFLSSTVTTALCNGGVHVAWGVELSDFTPLGTTIFTATSTGQKGVYHYQDSAAIGRAHVGTVMNGVTSGIDFEVTANKTKVFAINGSSAALTAYGWDTSLSAPSVDGSIINGVASQTTPFAGTSPSAYFSMGASNNGYSTAANTTAAFESVVLQNGTTNIPGNFTATPQNSIQTVYYTRDLQLVSGVWYFNLATSSTNPAVVPTANSATFTMMRAGGISTTQFLLKTAVLPTLTGNILTSNSFVATNPASCPAAPGLDGQDCLALGTSNTLYMGKVSDLTNASGAWASLSGVNLLGSGVDVIVPTAVLARFSKTLNRWLYVTNTSRIIMKQHQAGVIDRSFGGLINTYYEAQNPVAVPAGMAALVSISMAGGWLFMTGSTIGQRGVISCDVYSDSLFDYSYVVTPVMQVEAGSTLKYISTVEALFNYTDTMNFFIKSSSNPSDPIFSTNTGWTPVDTASDNSPMALGPYFRIKANYNNATYGNNTPPQLNEIIVTYEGTDESSDHFAGDVDHTSRLGETPTKTAFELIKVYSSTVPTLYFRAYDESNNLYLSANTSANAANFEYSTNNGVSWLPLGVIPNTVGTLIRYNWSTPPGVDVYPTIRES